MQTDVNCMWLHIRLYEHVNTLSTGFRLSCETPKRWSLHISVKKHLVPEVLTAQRVVVYHTNGNFAVSTHHVLYQLRAPPLVCVGFPVATSARKGGLHVSGEGGTPKGGVKYKGGDTPLERLLHFHSI